MPRTIKLKATDGTQVEYVDEIIGQGGMKDVYFSPDRSYVVAFFRDKQDYNSTERLENIVGDYRRKIFEQAGGEYWKKLYCWPDKLIIDKGRVAVTAPAYAATYFFEFGSANNDMLGIKGSEKEGKWFASANHRVKHLDPRERGDWFGYLRVCLKIARSVRRMHAAGLAHSDLSYKNVLVDPVGGNACLIDLDGLVVPGKFPPDVVGTPDFIAPEVMSTLTLPRQDKKKSLPRIETDRHALAVLVYMYLLYRHPLRGRKIHDQDPNKDEEMMMGSKALFVEDPSDSSNRPDPNLVRPGDLPWADPEKVPFSVTGPYLKELFERSFISGLHNPSQRPTAEDFEVALIRTIDLLQPCSNKNCDQKWFVFDNTRKPVCPFCGTTYNRPLPILNLYSARGGPTYRPDNHRVMVYHNQYLYQWHVYRNVFPNEKLTPEQTKPVGYFAFHGNKWVFVNQALTNLRDLTADTSIPVGQALELADGQQVLLSSKDGGRLIQVQMAGL
ncbi:kinase [bacterium]|nr:kinase [bacterium]MDA7929637.1 kinase [Akkermansiaceae bacterium]MDA7934240.1 kinase [Akkermansiaceae bacterium]